MGKGLEGGQSGAPAKAEKGLRGGGLAPGRAHAPSLRATVDALRAQGPLSGTWGLGAGGSQGDSPSWMPLQTLGEFLVLQPLPCCKGLGVPLEKACGEHRARPGQISSSLGRGPGDSQVPGRVCFTSRRRCCCAASSCRRRVSEVPLVTPHGASTQLPQAR